MRQFIGQRGRLPLERGVAVLLALAIAGGMLVAAAGARDAAAVPARGVTSEKSALLLSVSCSSAEMCMAVGSRLGNGNNRSLAEKWNGTSWTIIPTARPRGATGTYFYAV